MQNLNNILIGSYGYEPEKNRKIPSHNSYNKFC